MPEITVEVVYALPDVQTAVTLRVPQGTTIEQALKLSNLTARFPEIAGAPMGIFGRRSSGDTVLADQDRVEIYRPLRIDPKQRRRESGKRQAMRRGK
ncbi:MAG TPA: RnfH family protein [Burkholderiales bacterium]|nr:RnfH family protein [Burkholderiales bacterium]